MHEDELVARVKERAGDPKRYNSMAGLPGRVHPAVVKSFPPPTLAALRDAERAMGFALPSLLKRLYLEVGNGGFGPGYGLYGLSGGYREDDVGDLTFPDLYLVDADSEVWPKKLVPICNWGCCMGLCRKESHLRYGWRTG